MSESNVNHELLSEEELKSKLDEYSHLYYNTGESPLTDEEFDLLSKRYEEKFGTVYETETEAPRGKRLVDISHLFPNLVGTLSKASDLDEMSDWLDGVTNKLDIDLDYGNNDLELIVTEKFDGNSVVLSFDHEGKLVNALTRGKDGKGLDLTDYFNHNVLINDELLKPMSRGDLVGIKCEALITYEDFEELSKLLGKQYSNPRNLTAGILNSNEGYKYREFLTIAPLSVEYSKEGHSIERLDQIEGKIDSDILSHTATIPMEYYYVSDNDSVEEIIEDIKEIYDHYVNGERDDLPYMIDGLVVELSENSYRNELGRIGTRNNFDIAIKFPSLTARTKMVDIKWYMGKSGRATPVAVVEPVVFNGAVCDHVSLSNINRFNELNLHKGESVILEYHGDTLSYLIGDPGVDKSELNPNDKFNILEECPVCNHSLELNKSGAFLSCRNISCSTNIVGKIVNFLEKLDVKGLKEATVGTLVEALDLEDIGDLYDITEEDLEGIESFGEKTISHIMESINNVLHDIYDYQIIGSLGIEGIGRTKAEQLFSVVSFHDICYMDKDSNIKVQPISFFKDKFRNVSGVGDITVNALHQGLVDNISVIEVIGDIDAHRNDDRVNIKILKDEVVEVDSNIDPIAVVFTGFRDKDIKELAKSKGYIERSSVSGKTDLVVTKDISSTSGKVTKAHDLGIEVISLDEFKQRLEM